MRRTPVALLSAAVLLSCWILPGSGFAQRKVVDGGSTHRGVAKEGGTGREFSGVSQQILGMVVKDVPPESGVTGVLVVSVTPGGRADAAGVRAGDIIVSFGGEETSSVNVLLKGVMISMRLGMRQRGVQENNPVSVQMVVVRGGRQVTLTWGSGGVGARRQWIGLASMTAPAAWGREGAVVGSVEADSPADRAGIMIGDLVTAFNGQPVKSSADLDQAVSSAAVDAACAISVMRGDRTVDMTISVTARPAEGAAPSVQVKRRLLDINVLKYAVIDPAARTVTFVGKYDPRYKTGAIPYYELLSDALASPYPWFSLEPTPETVKAVRLVNEAIGRDCDRMMHDNAYTNEYAMKLLNVLLKDPWMKADGERFVAKGAEAFHISPADMRAVFLKSSGDSSISEDDMIPIMGRILSGMGYDQVGRALQNSEGDAQQALVILGISDQGNQIINAFHAGQISREQAGLRLGVLMSGAMLRGLRAPEAKVSSFEKDVLAGRQSLDAMSNYMNGYAMDLIVNDVGLKMFNGLTLSDKVLGRLYNVSTPKMNLVFKDVPADSVLGDVLYRADYALKSVCINPELRNSVPGFRTEIEYFEQEAAARGTRIPSDAGAQIGHRLLPGVVKMKVAPSGSVVVFDSAEVRIDGYIISAEGKRGGGATAVLMKSLVGGYSDFLTGRYDDLAVAFPELHRMREAEKVIALARWAMAGHYALAVDKAYGARVVQAPESGGFWQAVFTADPSRLSLNVVTEGGVSFDKDQGDAWVQPEVTRTVTSDVSKQLVMSTLLAKQAADSADAGDLETARSLADKSALAMTGDIDMTKLPALGDVPAANEPAQAITLSQEALDSVDQSLRQVEDAKINLAKAADLASTNPEEAARLQASARAEQSTGEAKIKELHDALDWARANYGQPAAAVDKIRAVVQVAPQPQPAAPVQSVQPTAPAPAQPAVDNGKKDALTPQEREKALKELARLEKELDSTKNQFLKLNRSIQQDQGQFAAWEKVAADGMDKCSGVLYNLLMDASAGQLADRYGTLDELARKLPNKPADLITRYNHIKNWFKAMSVTQSAKDVADIAARDVKTMPEFLEEIRDDLNIIASVTGLDKTVPCAALKYGADMVDMSYSYAQFSAAYDNINQLDKNSDAYLAAVKKLSARMEDIVKKVKDIKAELGIEAAPTPHVGRG